MPARCLGRNCSSIYFEQVGDIKCAFVGNPAYSEVVGGSFACLRCKTVICVTPDGVWENAFQPSAFVDSLKIPRARPKPDEEAYDMGMESEPPMPGMRAR